MKPTYKEIRAAAQYRWPEIHAAIGITETPTQVYVCFHTQSLLIFYPNAP